MNTEKLFTRAVAALPQAIRKRLDGSAPLDWTVLEDPRTGTRLAEAGRVHARLPETVEVLANRLVYEVGIVPADLAGSAELQRDPAAWIRQSSIESEGESYCILNRLSGEVHACVRPEAIAGYTILALELAAAVHEAVDRWIEAGELHRAVDGGATSLLGLYAVRMLEHLRPASGGSPERRTAAELAALLDRVWNTQELKTRAALSAIRLRNVRGAHAPRRSHYAPMTGFRLHSFDPGEVQWLRILAEQAIEAASTDVKKKEEEGRPAAARLPAAAPPQKPPATEATDSSDISALEARIRAANEETAKLLQLGSPTEELTPERELRGLREAAEKLPDAVRRRIRESSSIGFAHALSRLRNTEDADAVRVELGAALAKQSVPRWLEELATALLADAGAQSREGTRTGGLRLHPEEEPEAGYRAVEIEGGAAGRVTALGLIEQVHLGLSFAADAWRGHTAIRSAGKEGGWILDKGEAEGSAFSESERETLEAARRMEQVLDRIQRGRGTDAPTALEEASMTADTFRGIGAATRAAAGWPGSAEAPDPLIPGDVERIAAVSEALHERIRSIANKHIASWIAGNGDSGVGRNGRPAMDRDEVRRKTA